MTKIRIIFGWEQMPTTRKMLPESTEWPLETETALGLAQKAFFAAKKFTKQF